MPRDWWRGDVLGRALLRGPIGEGPRGGPRDGTLRVALGNAQGKALGMAVRMALGGHLARALGMMLRMALGRALARSHMHGPSASTAQPGTSKPSPKHNAAQGCGHGTKRPAAGFRKLANALVFASFRAYLAAPAVG